MPEPGLPMPVYQELPAQVPWGLASSAQYSAPQMPDPNSRFNAGMHPSAPEHTMAPLGEQAPVQFTQPPLAPFPPSEQPQPHSLRRKPPIQPLVDQTQSSFPRDGSPIPRFHRPATPHVQSSRANAWTSYEQQRESSAGYDAQEPVMNSSYIPTFEADEDGITGTDHAEVSGA